MYLQKFLQFVQLKGKWKMIVIRVENEGIKTFKVN